MYPIIALLGLMFLTWGAAIWASYIEEPGAQLSKEKVRKAA